MRAFFKVRYGSIGLTEVNNMHLRDSQPEILKTKQTTKSRTLTFRLNSQA